MKKKNKENNKILHRKNISQEYRWDVKSLYDSIDNWENDFLKAEKLRNELIKYKDSFLLDDKSFLQCLLLKDEVSKIMQNLLTYAHMRKDEDNQNEKYQSIYYRSTNLLTKIEDNIAFIQPGILSLKYKTLREWINKNNKLKLYKHYIEDIYRKKSHILRPNEEKIIAQAGEMAMVPENTYGLLSNADLRFPKVKDKDGNIITISQSNFVSLLRNRDRQLRKKVYKKYYQPYKQHRNTFAALLGGNLKKDRFFSHTRKYRNSLEASLFEDNIPVSVYDNLLRIIHENIELLHNYIMIKKDYLNLKKLHMYDMYVPLTEKTVQIDYLDAQDIVIKSLSPMGNEYQSIVKKGFNEKWIDVYENRGKTSGAYSTGSYQSKPFILMNYHGTIEDVYTLSHELGHSLHSYYTNKRQPFIYSNYPIFLAEIASTTNEVLLTNYLLNKAASQNDKLIILNHFLEQFRTTLFRQTMFAEYEKILHEYEASSGSITAEWCSQKYSDLIRYYYGENVIIDDEIKLEWARIPHFYYNYYVYQYATGFAAAIAFSRMILADGNKATEKYLEFLSKGSSDYPIDILKKSGIDMTKVNPISEAIKLFSELLTQLKK
ncbi:MAG: oligoendopeptidase F [Atribacterota bacterium]|jgi:oligoendopeptidase F|nr:oligoendopeptidase F [Atribacterota bacterium]MDD3031124.1 oligoendopeptidase F [Atribacterota bacterium]MDD3640502.1 oligoendopeptidase F [Atribacterota bacterium]MDD4288890.1 oligoendopeptidase F [Atribacterota bacterium]MDD4764523.1 oligoendopeptidase F [Atribacterota bacterium]